MLIVTETTKAPPGFYLDKLIVGFICTSPVKAQCPCPSTQDDCPAAGVFDPVLAALEVHPLPAEALERVQTRAGFPQEGL